MSSKRNNKANGGANTPGEETKVSPGRGTTPEKSSSKKASIAFLPDDVIGKSFFHRLMYYVFLIPFWRWFYAYSDEGWDKVEKYSAQGKGVFMIGRYFT